jgi:hypothetical protein
MNAFEINNLMFAKIIIFLLIFGLIKATTINKNIQFQFKEFEFKETNKNVRSNCIFKVLKKINKKKTFSCKNEISLNFNYCIFLFIQLLFYQLTATL